MLSCTNSHSEALHRKTTQNLRTGTKCNIFHFSLMTNLTSNCLCQTIWQLLSKQLLLQMEYVWQLVGPGALLWNKSTEHWHVDLFLAVLMALPPASWMLSSRSLRNHLLHNGALMCWNLNKRERFYSDYLQRRIWGLSLFLIYEHIHLDFLKYDYRRCSLFLYFVF